MSVDYSTCNSCGEVFCECGYYVRCKCGRVWCSDECSGDDFYSDGTCKAEGEVECDEECDECNLFVEEKSCIYCREEDFEDSELLKFTLKLLNINREDLIKKYKEK